MGQAKQKLEAIRASLLRVGEGWLLPPSEEERQMVRAVSELPILKVRRASMDWMKHAGMQPRHCHLNCKLFAENDRSGRTRIVHGWMLSPTGDVYILHSVIERDGKMNCITPNEMRMAEIDFVEDGNLEMIQQSDGQFEFFRQGAHVKGAGLRLNPEATIEKTLKVKARLEAGEDPFKVMHEEFSDSA